MCSIHSLREDQLVELMPELHIESQEKSPSGERGEKEGCGEKPVDWKTKKVM